MTTLQTDFFRQLKGSIYFDKKHDYCREAQEGQKFASSHTVACWENHTWNPIFRFFTQRFYHYSFWTPLKHLIFRSREMHPPSDQSDPLLHAPIVTCTPPSQLTHHILISIQFSVCCLSDDKLQQTKVHICLIYCYIPDT